MMRIDKNEKRLVVLQKSALAQADHWERNLQEMICNDPDAFCEEIGESLWVIGKEVRPSDAVADRIDILAVDDEANAVIIELKRGTHKLQLLQATSYAGMISRWSEERFIETLAANYSQSRDEARAAIEEHIATDISAVNNSQRILLIAEDFDPALLVASEWLHETYGVDIRCYRMQLSQENGNDYLTCTCIYPPMEIAALTRGTEGKSNQQPVSWGSWDAALDDIENVALKNFVLGEVAKNQESRLSNREVIYRVDGKRRFWLGCRKKYAYIWQGGRFDSDLQYWRQALSEPNHVQEVNDKYSLRFRLSTPSDFAAFGKAMQDLSKAEFFEYVEPPADQ